MDIELRDYKLKTLDYRSVKPFQGQLKEPLSAKQEKKLLKSFKEKGKFIPEFAWMDADGVYWSMDGHRRLELYNKHAVRFNGSYKCKFLIIEANNKTDAKEKLLLLNSHYGEITKAGLKEFVKDLEDIEFLMETTSFSEFEDISFLKAQQEMEAIETEFLNSQEETPKKESNQVFTPTPPNDEEKAVTDYNPPPAVSKNSFVSFTEMMTMDQKVKLTDVLFSVKKKKEFRTNADCLEFIIEKFIQQNADYQPESE